MEKAVKDLSRGDAVKITPRHKPRIVAQVDLLGDNVPEQYRGKALVIWNNCSQWITDP